jgi:hypothetical protein
MQIRQHWNYNEPCEPEIEKPSVLPRVVEALKNDGWTLSEIAQDVHLSEIDLELLIYADDEEYRLPYILKDSPPYTSFLLNGDIELNRNRPLFVEKIL